MPNWTTNKLITSPEVLRDLVNDKGRVDFNKVLPNPCPEGNDWNGYIVLAESLARKKLNTFKSSTKLVMALEMVFRQDIDETHLTEEELMQYRAMLRNYAVCGYLHQMDFAEKVWGTKWNASKDVVQLERGIAHFETPHYEPTPVYIELSKRFPEELLTVLSIDEVDNRSLHYLTITNGIITNEHHPLGHLSQKETLNQESRARLTRLVRYPPPKRRDLRDLLKPFLANLPSFNQEG